MQLLGHDDIDIVTASTGAEALDLLRKQRCDCAVLDLRLPGGALPATVATEWLVTAWDQNAGLNVMSPAAAVVEEVAAGWLLDLLGLPKRPESLDEAMRVAFVLPLQFTPGEQTVYASSDYAVLMRLIDRVTGKPFSVFMHDQLFEPLGMTATRFDNAVEEDLIRKSEMMRSSLIFPTVSPSRSWLSV